MSLPISKASLTLVFVREFYFPIESTAAQMAQFSERAMNFRSQLLTHGVPQLIFLLKFPLPKYL